MHASAGPRRGRTESQWQRTKEHRVDHDAVGGRVSKNATQLSVLTGQRTNEDPAEVVFHPPHAPPGRRLAVGVGHHQVMGVVVGREGDKGGAGRLHLSAVVRRGEEGDHVVVGTQVPGQRQQRRGVALSRRRTQQVAPGRHRPAGHRATTAPLQAGRVSAPSTLDPSSPASVLTVTTPCTGSNVAGSFRMASSTVVRSPRV